MIVCLVVFYLFLLLILASWWCVSMGFDDYQ